MTLVLRGMLKGHIPAGSPRPPKLVSKNYDCRKLSLWRFRGFFQCPEAFFYYGLQNSFLEFRFNDVGFKKIWW